MHRSASLNKLPVTVLPAAVSDRQGVSKLYLSCHGKASNSLNGSGPAQTIVTVTLDWMLDYFPAPQVLKIDVEGLESAVFAIPFAPLSNLGLLFFAKLLQNTT
jgi:FkbM family methyltransferase